MDTAASKRRLGDIFVERGLITPEQLQEALAEQRENGAKLGEILVEMGYMTRIELAGAISEQWTDRGLTFSGRKAQEHAIRAEASAAGPSVVEVALRERLEAMTAEVAARDERIARQSATIDALLLRVKDLESALADREL
jgi:hypothetical protein